MINDKKSVIFDFISPFIQTVKRNGQYLQKYQKLWKLTSVYEMTYRFVLGPTLLNSLELVLFYLEKLQRSKWSKILLTNGKRTSPLEVDFQMKIE